MHIYINGQSSWFFHSIQDIHNEKTDYIFENIFRLMSLSIHSLFTIKTATKIISCNKSVIIIVGNKWIKTKWKPITVNQTKLHSE